MMNVLFIVTDGKSANGICVKAIMNEMVKRKTYNVYCVTNREKGKPFHFVEDKISYFTVSPRFISRLEAICADGVNSPSKNMLRLLLKLLNKATLLLSIPTWPLISRGYAKRIYKAVKTVSTQNKIDLIIPVFQQIEALVAANRIKEYNPSIVYILYFLDSLSGGQGPRQFSKKWSIERGKRWERKLLKNADYIVMMQSAKEHYSKNCINETYYARIDYLDLPLYTKWDHKDLFDSNQGILDRGCINLLYIGTIPAHIRDPRIFLEVFCAIKDPKLRLVFIGSNTCPHVFEEFCGNDKRIKVYPFVEHDQAIALMHEADVLVNLGNNLESMTPSKVFEYMSAGKPIVSTAPIRKEPSIKYLKRYPAAHILYYDGVDREMEAERMLDFIYKNVRIDIDQEKVRADFYENTPEAFLDYIEERL